MVPLSFSTLRPRPPPTPHRSTSNGKVPHFDLADRVNPTCGYPFSCIMFAFCSRNSQVPGDLSRKEPLSLGSIALLSSRAAGDPQPQVAASDARPHRVLRPRPGSPHRSLQQFPVVAQAAGARLSLASSTASCFARHTHPSAKKGPVATSEPHLSSPASDVMSTCPGL